MPNILRRIFGVNTPTPQGGVVPQNQTVNQRLTGETYKQWGHRMAGLNAGNNQSLNTHLQIVVQNIKREQLANQAIQAQNQQQIRDQISSKESDLAREKSLLDSEQAKVDDINAQIGLTNEEIQKVKGEAKRTNRDARVNYIIGLFILIPLTIYLFVFYSSASYSAFFKTIDANSTDSLLSSHIFDGNALGNAFSESFGTGVFVLLITFIFLSLGYILHRYTEKKGGTKYLYIIGLIIATFVFDSLIAYRVSKITYDARNLTDLQVHDAYSIKIAFGQADFWMVICCGFLAYMIWGLLFGFVMESFKQLDLNKVEQNNLLNRLSQLKQNLQSSSDKIGLIKGNIASLQNEIDGLNTKLRQTGIIDFNTVRLEVNNFFSGWLQYLNAAGKPQTDIDTATDTVNELLKTLK